MTWRRRVMTGVWHVQKAAVFQLLTAVSNTCLWIFIKSQYWCFCYLHTIVRRWVNPHGVTSLHPLDLWWSGALLPAAWSVCCAAWLRVLEHIGKLWVCLFLTPSLVCREHCAGLEKGLPFWPQISRESQPVSSKGGLPPRDLQPPQRWS